MARRAGPEGQKSAVITLRLTPRVRFGLELMTRIHQESVPEVVARAISDAFTSEQGGLFVGADEETGLPFDLLKLVWAERPSDRLANLAFRFPSVMSRTEKEIWERVRATPKYWRPERARKAPKPSESALNRDALAEDWAAISENAKAVPAD